MARLIAKDVVLTITIGNNAAAVGYTAPSFATGTALCSRAKSYSRSTEFGMVESGALCDIQQYNRPTRVSGTIELDMNLVFDTVAANGIFLGKEGYFVRVVANLSHTVITDIGIISSVSISAETDGTISEQVTITLAVDGDSGLTGAVVA
jgi:hypothetical protein